ncbi:SPX-domain-containing protein [Backusella circina FSU 941]|nr:SPX-domain-containing protein [Backusella circina FSU 941]
MKFGEYLAERVYEPWRLSYLQYNVIKVEFKRRQLEHGWNKNDELEFSHKIKSELTKVYQFVERGLNELTQRAEQSEAQLQRLTSTGDKNKSKYDAIADTLTEILFDVNDLAKFHRLNVTGFDKIIKKHDRWTKLDLRSQYRQQMIPQFPLDKMVLQFDVLIVRISDIHDICNLHGNPRSNQNYNQGEDQTAFERATAKYWIHPDNITEVKSIILFHLPVHVFNKKKKYEESDMAVSSVYFDNDQFDLYNERLHRADGAEAVRLRWYGPCIEENDNIYVERKTHNASWLSGKSVKDRFRLKETLVNSFLSGDYNAEQIAEELRSKQSKKEGINKGLDLGHVEFIANGIQKSLKDRNLKPMCRVFYNRTAFQLPGDQRLRISLDSNLTFIREDGKERRKEIGPNGALHWRRDDIGIDYPFRQLPDEDVSRFPYAILETKLQTHLGQESPAWLTALTESHLVHEVPRFSKYLHGASSLFHADVPLHPYWLGEFDMDIRRDPIENIGLSRSMSFKPLVNGRHRQSLMLMYEKELDKLEGNTTDYSKKKKGANLPHLSISLLDVDSPNTEKRNYPKDMLSRVWNHGTTPLSAGGPLSAGAKDSPLLPRVKGDVRKYQKGKEIKKIEPKTFFANERTFISWLQFCALLLTVALNLLNTGDHISRVIGAIFIVFASLLCIYALGRYQLRAWQLRTNRHITRYDDIYGPTVLCIMLVTALVINFYLRSDAIMNGTDPRDAPDPRGHGGR